MRIFVSEFICGGSLAGHSLPESLRREGAAMLLAIIADLARVPGCLVTTTLDARVTAELLSRLPVACESFIATDDSDEARHFERLAKSADAVLVIAPETDGHLARKVSLVESLGVRSLNCSSAAIELCGDKLRLADHLERHGIPTIPTKLVDWDQSPLELVDDERAVVKPRDGAGSWLTFPIRTNSADEWLPIARAYEQAEASHKALIQPYVSGHPISVSCLCHPEADPEVFPIGQQSLSDDFRYLGGTIPVSLTPVEQLAIRSLVSMACRSVPGLKGYVGFDLILPTNGRSEPILVEINPRLTTSYVGYRQLCAGNLAEHWLTIAGLMSNSSGSSLEWSSSPVEFDSAGGTKLLATPKVC